MDLANARDLKHRLRRAAGDQRSRFAAGISLSSATGDYRVAVIVSSKRDEHILRSSSLKRFFDRHQRDIEMEVAGARPAGSSPVATTSDGALRIGASVGHHLGGIGALGFFARRRSDGRLGIVSCNHVIAMADRGREGDRICSPSSLDGGTSAVALLDGGYPRLSAPSGDAIDCAFATLIDDIPYDPASLATGSLVPAPPDVTVRMTVAAAGRATRGRLGLVEKIEIDGIWMRYGKTRIAFDDVIQIGSASEERFSHFGDSGALVYTTDTFQPVGLLFATSSAGGPHNAGWTWVHPVSNVTRALQVDLACA